MSDNKAPVPTPKVIYHVAQTADLQAAQAQGSYKAPSLETEGFIHCCLSEQLDGVLQRYFSGVSDYQVIRINVAELPESLDLVLSVFALENEM